MCSRPRCRRDLSRRADSRDGAVDASGAVHLTTTPADYAGGHGRRREANGDIPRPRGVIGRGSLSLRRRVS